jgi:hypothetical protein
MDPNLIRRLLEETKKLEPFRERMEEMASIAEQTKSMLENTALEQFKNLEPFRHEIERLNEITKLRNTAVGAFGATERLALELAKTRPVEERMLESLYRPDYSRFDALLKTIKPIAQQRSEGFHATIKNQIKELQDSLSPDKELLIYYHSGTEVIRILHIATPDWETVVLTGVDEQGNPSRVISSIHSVQFVCKIIDVPPQQKRIVGFSMPEKEERAEVGGNAPAN